MMHELSEEKHGKNVRFFAPRPARRRHPSTHRHAKISARGGPAGVLHARCGRDACRHACEGEAKVLQLDAARRLLVRDVRQHGQSGPSALPQLGSCASSGHAWPARYFERSILWAPSHRLGCSSQPPPKPPIPPPLTIQVRRVLQEREGEESLPVLQVPLLHLLPRRGDRRLEAEERARHEEEGAVLQAEDRRTEGWRSWCAEA